MLLWVELHLLQIYVEVLAPNTSECDLIWKQGLCSCDRLWHLPSSPSRFWAQCAGPWLRLDISPSGAQLHRLGEGVCRTAQSSELLVMRRCAPDEAWDLNATSPRTS